MSSKEQSVQFQALREEDLQEWRLLPQTQALLGLLSQAEANSLRNCASASQQGVHHQAAALGALAEHCAWLMRLIAEPRVAAPVVTTDTTYVDPAKRPSKRGKLNAI